MNAKQGLRRIAVPLLSAGWLCTQAAGAATPDESEFDVFVGDRVTYDDNLFRLPAGVAPEPLSPDSRVQRSDYINRISAGLDSHWVWQRQSFDVDLNVSDHRYSRNDELDHTAGNGRLLWNWRTAGDLSGRAGAEYSRALASFANSRVYTRDLLDTFSYFGDARFGIGSRWALLAGGRRLEIAHGAAVRERDDYEGDIVTGGIEYRTPAAAVIGLDYAHTAARFPEPEFLAGEQLERDYAEDTAVLRVRYPLTAKTVFEGRGGWLRREHDNPAIDDFSGDVWRLSLIWQPGVKTQIAFSGWRELEAYADTESDYFKTTGASITPLWSPTDKFKLQMALSWEEQDYVGSNPAFPDSLARRDEVAAGGVELQYLPRSLLEFALALRHEERDSNRAAYGFDDNLGSFSLRLIF